MNFKRLVKSAQSDITDIFYMLRNLESLQEFGDTDLEAVASRCYIRQYKTNETIYAQESPSAALYFLISGSAALFRQRYKHNDRVRYISSDHIFGYTALLSEKPRDTSAKALEPCTTIVITRQDLQILQFEHPSIAQQLLIAVLQAVYSELAQLRFEFHELATRLAQVQLKDDKAT